jgi:hypothetical protein
MSTAAETFFATIFGTAPERALLRLMTPRTWSPVTIPTGDATRAAQVALDLNPDTYIACGLYGPIRETPGRRGRARDVIGITAMWADLDVAKPTSPKRYLPNRAVARRFLATLAVRPTIQVWTGGGYHPWWVLKEALTIDTDADRARVERLMRRWQAYLRLRLGGYALDSTFDLSRVLRVPSTLNSKYTALVELEDTTGPRVDPAEIEELCVGVPDVLSISPHMTSVPSTLDPRAVPPADKFGQLCRRSPLFAQLWRRELAPRDGSQSGFDFRLATLAASAGWTDEEIVALLIAHRRDSGRTPAPARYYARTIGQARGAATRRSLREPS